MYTIPYIILILLFGLLSVLWSNSGSESNKRLYYIACIAIYVFFFGFRGFVFDDWIVYYTVFNKCELENVSFYILKYNIEWGMEPGFTLLMYICRCLVGNFHFFVFVCTAINVALLCLFFKDRMENKPLAFVLFLTFGGVVMSINLMRNSIAILIFINSLRFIEQRRLLPYMLLCILAALFHVSALLYIPFYFIVRYRYNKWVFIGILIVANTIFLLHVPVVSTLLKYIFSDAGSLVQSKLDTYTSGNMDEMKTLSIGYLERLFSSILIICYYDKLCEIRKENILFINFFIVYILASFLLCEFSEICLRISNLFIFAYWILWADLTECFSIKNNRTLYVYFVSFYCMLKMVGTTNMITASYDNILFGAKSYEERLYFYNRYSKK